MIEPAYEFTIRSIFDKLALDCRIYHPPTILSDLENVASELKCAIVAHPYAPLGGSYDDFVVLSVTDTLLQHGYITGTFNFRGAGTSEGKTSWTGRGEIEDYVSFTGFMLHYLRQLKPSTRPGEAVELSSPDDHPLHLPPVTLDNSNTRIKLLAAGYSFGSLVLAHLPPISTIANRFETAEDGSVYLEIILRARTLAKHTWQSYSEEQQRPSTPQGRSHATGQASPSGSPRLRGSPVMMGGDEKTGSNRRLSRDSKKGADVVRELPHRIRTHIRRHSGSKRRSAQAGQDSGQSGDRKGITPALSTAYLMVSPVLLPFTTTLAPPGLPLHAFHAARPFHHAPEDDNDLMALKSPSFVVFGSADTFTSSRKLQQWSERLAKASNGLFEWTMIEDAGHFWREEGAMQTLKARLSSWVTSFNDESHR